jgi:2-dehydropantoate 2-reductase
MKLGVFGAGAIGAYVGGRLLASGALATLVARGSLGADVAAAGGLRLTDYRGYDETVPAAHVTVAAEAAALADCEVVFVAVKAGATAAAAAALAPRLRRDAVVVSLQNGVRNVELLRAALGDRTVLGGVVGFNVQRGDGPAHLHQATSGKLAIAADPAAAAVVATLARAGFDAAVETELPALAWGKLLLNLNNAVNALSGLPLRDELGQRGYRRVFAACLAEGVAVLDSAGIPVRVDAPLPPSLLPAVLRLPDGLFKLAARRMLTIDGAARSSMQEDVQRRRPTEIDLLNGELAALGARHGVKTPFNDRVIDLVKRAEKGELPSLSAGELERRVLAATSG